MPAKGRRPAFKKHGNNRPAPGLYDLLPNASGTTQQHGDSDYVDTDVYEQPYSAYQDLAAGGAVYDELALRPNGNRQRLGQDPSSSFLVNITCLF